MIYLMKIIRKVQVNNILNISIKELNKGFFMLLFIVFIKSLFIVMVIGLVGVGLFIYFGLYFIGVDVFYNKLSYWLLEILCE